MMTLEEVKKLKSGQYIWIRIYYCNVQHSLYHLRISEYCKDDGIRVDGPMMFCGFALPWDTYGTSWKVYKTKKDGGYYYE